MGKVIYVKQCYDCLEVMKEEKIYKVPSYKMNLKNHTFEKGSEKEVCETCKIIYDAEKEIIEKELF